MKKLFILLTTSLVLLGSCDSLDITPSGNISIPDIFENDHYTEGFLNTVYNYIPGYFYSYSNFNWLAPLSDEAQGGSLDFVDGWIDGNLSPSNGGPNSFYSNWWRGIRFANEFLQNVDNANIPNEGNRARFKAEAKLLRAFYYWELVKQYGRMPILEEALNPDFDFKSLKRPATFQENIDFIVQDCNDAIATSQLPMRVATQDEMGRFSKAVAYAIKSEALLFNASPLWNPDNDQAKWQAASAAAKEALDALTKDGTYELTPLKDYESYFDNIQDAGSSPRDKESILTRPNTNNGLHLISYDAIPSKSGGARSTVNPSQELVDSYDMQNTGEPPILGYEDDDHLEPIINPASGYDPQNPYEGRDPRFYATIWYNGAEYDNVNGNMHIMETFVGGSDQWMSRTEQNSFNTHTGYYLRKFVDPALQIGQVATLDWKIYRLAEIYLNLAEAENEANGPTTVAKNAINAVRARAEMPDLPDDLNKEEFRERVRKERRVELAFEEKRFWDVRRWKILDETDKLVTAMVINKQADNNFKYERQVIERRHAWQDKFLIYPIPIGDASKVPDLSENQNPGW